MSEKFPDNLVITFLERSLFETQEGIKLSTYTISDKMPVLILEDDDVILAREVGSSANAALVGGMSAIVVIQIALGGSMAMLWALLHTIQLLTMIPAFSFIMPGFLYEFFANLNDMNFGFLDFDDMIIEIGQVTDTEEAWS